jgi:hypothetical protein
VGRSDTLGIRFGDLAFNGSGRWEHLAALRQNQIEGLKTDFVVAESHRQTKIHLFQGSKLEIVTILKLSITNR